MKKLKENDAAKAQHIIIGVDNEVGNEAYIPPAPESIQWYDKGAMGVLYSWGISSIHGGIDLSWSMMANTPWDTGYKGKNKITPRDYYNLADSFNPSNYDPRLWLEPAAEAGFTYAVLTTKHHDGYALWPSVHGELSTRTHMNGRDLVGPFVDACREFGMKAGLYYSPPDWFFNRNYISFNYPSYDDVIDEWLKEENTKESRPYDMDHKAVELPSKPIEFQKRYERYLADQIRELLSSYGDIDMLFFDGKPEVISFDEIRSLQPNVLVNTRMHGYGDYLTPECHRPEKRPESRWEGVYIWNYHDWGYQEPNGYRPTGWLLSNLAHCRAWGGNMLVNCAPMSDGSMPESYFSAMKELKYWMKTHKESVFPAGDGCYPERCSVPVTKWKKTYYLHLLPYDPENDVSGTTWYRHVINPSLEKKRFGMQPKKATLEDIDEPESVILMSTGREVPYNYSNRTLQIELPKKQSSPLDDVVVVTIPD